MSRQSLVTPIDWKLRSRRCRRIRRRSRQSLVTPIDWKPDVPKLSSQRQKLESPILGDAY